MRKHATIEYRPLKSVYLYMQEMRRINCKMR